MTFDWQPDPSCLSYLQQLLSAAATAGREQQAQLTQALETFKEQPGANNYLMALFAASNDRNVGIDVQQRVMAGLILKNNLRTISGRDVGEYDVIKKGAIQALSDRSSLVRQTAGIIITSLIEKFNGELSRIWPSLFDELFILIASGENILATSALTAIEKVCQDSAQALAEDEGGKSVGFLIPRLLALMRSESIEIRIHAISTMNCFIYTTASAFDDALPEFLTVLSERASVDHDDRIRKLLCEALTDLLEAYPEELSGMLAPVASYMLNTLLDPSAEVALQACEFWCSLVQHDNAAEILAPYLETLIPILLRNMAYAQDDPELLENQEDSSVPDRVEQIKPRHHRTAKHVAAESIESIANGLEDGEEESEGEEEEGEPVSWNLRKCSASTLDILSNSIAEHDMLRIALPLIQHQLMAQDWRQRELGILALGAIFDGVKEGMAPHLPTVLPFLIDHLRYPKPLVRAISAWTLSKYSSFCAYYATQSHPEILETAVASLLNGMLDGNKRVQKACCSAMAVFSENAAAQLSPYLDSILNTFAMALQKYQTRNRMLLYDAIGTLANGSNNVELLLGSEGISKLLPMLVNQWTAVSDDDPTLFPLLEAISALAIVAGKLFAPYVQVIYQRAVSMIKAALGSESAEDGECHADETLEQCVMAIDLIGGLVVGLGDQLAPLLIGTEPSLSSIVLASITSNSEEIKQSGFALVGDCAQKCFAPLEPILIPLLNSIMSNLDPIAEVPYITNAIANNAVWALGELCVYHGPSLSPYVLPFIECLATCINHGSKVSTNYSGNVAVTLGRALFVLPAEAKSTVDIIPLLSTWAPLISKVVHSGEKESAFRGICSVLCSVAAASLCRLVPNQAGQHILYPHALPQLLQAMYMVGEVRDAELKGLMTSAVQRIVSEAFGGMDAWSHYRHTILAHLPDDFEAKFGLL